MFTGIVEELGLVRELVADGESMVLGIGCNLVLKDLKIGDSLAVNGICLTVKEKQKDHIFVDVMPETRRRTNLAKLKKGDRVNLERALLLGQRLGGHLVSGHIDGLATIKNKVREGNAIIFTLATAPELSPYFIEKGSVTLEGVSLTIAKIEGQLFQVSLIPLTARATTLGEKKIGDSLNLECDLIGKYMERYWTIYQAKQPRGLDLTYLGEQGFLY